MAKVLQLQFIKTFVSPLTNGQTIRKGEIIKVSDAAAEKLQRNSEVDVAENVHPHFVERDESLVEVNYDFTAGAEDKSAVHVSVQNAAPAAPAALAEVVKKTPQRVQRKAT